MRPPFCQTTMPVRELHVRRRRRGGGDGSGGEQRQDKENHALHEILRLEAPRRLQLFRLTVAAMVAALRLINNLEGVIT